MRITIIGGPFQPWPPAPCGSIERIWHGMAREFARSGHTVTAICQRHPSQPASETIEGVIYRRKWRFSRTRSINRDLFLDMLFSLRTAMMSPRADIVVPHTFWLPAILPRVRPGAGRVVAHVQRFPKGQMGLYLKAACITTVSRTIQDAIVGQCPAAEPLVRVVPNPIHLDVFTPPPAPRPFGPSGVILYTGRIHPEKGLHLLVQAYCRIQTRWPDLRLRLIGPSEVARGGGGPEFVDQLRSLAGRAPVEILPSIDKIEDLARVLQEASYYCYPSTAETGEASPVAPLEAMATGLAPVVSDLGQFRDYLEPGSNGMVFDHRAADPVSELARCLEQLISDPGRSARMARDAIATASKFSYAAVASMYLREFEQLLDRSAAGGSRGAP